MNKLAQLLQAQDTIIADGGMGTMLMAAGLTQGDAPELWNVTHPEKIKAIHQGYVEAGAQIILTNSFGGNPFRLKMHNLQDRVHELNKQAAILAREVADAADQLVVVAGSMGPSGEIMAPVGSLFYPDAVAGFAAQAQGLVDGGVDVLWIETMSDLLEVRAAAAGVRQVTDLPVVATLTFDTNGRTMMGVSPEEAISELTDLGVLALGGNCGNGPHEITAVIQTMYAHNQTIPLVAKSNAGIPQYINGELHYDGTPKVMAEYAVKVRNSGARIIGACCGSTPAHIAAIASALASSPIARKVQADPPAENTPPRPRRTHRRTSRRE